MSLLSQKKTKQQNPFLQQEISAIWIELMEIPKQPPSFDPTLVREILSKRCVTHPTECCDLIHLSSTSKSSRICEKCKKTKIISDSEVVSVQEILQSVSEASLPFLQTFSSEDISQKVKFMVDSLEVIQKKIESYYAELLYAIEAAIINSKENIKRKTELLVNRFVKSIESVKQTSTIGQLQDILLSRANTDDEDSKLTNFFQSAYKSSSANKMYIKDLYNSFNIMKDHFSSIKPNEILTNIAKHIQEISLVPSISFPQNNLEYNSLTESNLLESLAVLPYSQNYYQSHEIIHQIDEQTLLIQNKNTFYSQTYLDYPLENSQKYVLRIQFLQSSSNKQPFFIIALFKDFGLKNNSFSTTHLNYCEIYGGGMMKIIKGQHLWAGNQNIGDTKRIEFRFHLDKKVMKAASYPDYNNVVEISSPSQIEENCQYYIGFSIVYPNDGIRILDFRKVRQFDKNMD